ncbi:MAG: hypothetical protein P4L40_14145 [Terracidiphilus sp.]|nr:hypothetical protein [Terracidiphilus sp.]
MNVLVFGCVCLCLYECVCVCRSLVVLVCVSVPAGCELLSAACEDKVAQVFFAAVPVLHTLFSGKCARIPLDGQDDFARATVR